MDSTIYNIMFRYVRDTLIAPDRALVSDGLAVLDWLQDHAPAKVHFEKIGMIEFSYCECGSLVNGRYNCKDHFCGQCGRLLLWPEGKVCER